MALDRNLVIRTLSGIVMLVVVLGAVLVSPYTMAVLFVLLTIGAQWEFYKIAQLTGAAPLRVYPTILGALLVGGGFAVVTGMLSLSWLLCLLPLYGVLFITELYRKSSMPLTNVAWALTGIMYIAVPFALLTVLPCTEAPEEGFVYNPLVVLGVIFTVWAVLDRPLVRTSSTVRTNLSEKVVGRIFGRCLLCDCSGHFDGVLAGRIIVVMGRSWFGNRCKQCVWRFG